MRPKQFTNELLQERASFASPFHIFGCSTKPRNTSYPNATAVPERIFGADAREDACDTCTGTRGTALLECAVKPRVAAASHACPDAAGAECSSSAGICFTCTKQIWDAVAEQASDANEESAFDATMESARRSNGSVRWACCPRDHRC